jgi:hypothetical protein
MRRARIGGRMESAERQIFTLLGTVSTGFNFLIAIAVLVLGLVVVRPLNKVAGLAFAGAGGGRLVILVLDVILDALQPKDAELSTIMIFSTLGTLLWMFGAVVFYGGVMFGSVKLAQTQSQQSPQAQRGGAW